jgi:hypothetical protein
MTYYYTYVHIRPDTGVIFNVGKGKGRRAWSKSDRNKHWHNVVNKNGGKFEVRILNWFNDEAVAYDAEIWQIAAVAPLGNLVNQTPGGDAPPKLIGNAHPAKRTPKDELSRRGKKAYQTRIDNGTDMSGDKNPMRRPEVAAKTSATLKAKGENHHSKRPSARANMSAGQKALGDKHPSRQPENKIKNSIGVTRAWSEKPEEDRISFGTKISDRMNARSDEEKAITAQRKSTSIKIALSKRSPEEKAIQFAKLSKPVMNLITGETFISGTAAAKHYGYPNSEWVNVSCRAHAKGKLKKLKKDGYHFAFIKKDDNNV